MTSLGSCLYLNTVDITQGTGAKELAELYKKIWTLALSL